jgi:hypothetical protein
MVMLAGTVTTDVSQLINVTVIPPAGAAPLRVTVAVALLPLLTVLGFTVMLVIARLEVTASDAVLFTPL